jgi:hypothetical protein
MTELLLISEAEMVRKSITAKGDLEKIRAL